MPRETIQTTAAPAAIGPYAQAVRMGDTVYLAGQIPLRPDTMTLVQGGIEAEIEQVLANLQAVANAAGGSFSDIVKLTVFLTDLADFAKVNERMAEWFAPPYPARAVVGVAALPKGARVEIDAILVLGSGSA